MPEAIVLTAALTEGPYFVDERLNRSDIRGRKLRLITGSTTTCEFTSQFFFDESLTDTVHTQQPYAAKGQWDVRNNDDGICNS